VIAPAYAALYQSRRRVRAAPYKRAEIFARWGNLCCYCDAPAEHLDHVIPLSKGGADRAHNLVPACAGCNLTKSNQSLADWASTF
jgi:5-methylcytosine-specific restriction endonuclease McrA